MLSNDCFLKIIIDRRGSPSCVKAFIYAPLRKKVFLLNYLRRPIMSLFYNLGLIRMVEWPSHCLLEIVRMDQMIDFFILHDIPTVWYNLSKRTIPRSATKQPVLPGGWNLLYSVLVRACTLELSVHRSIYCIFYIFGIFWSVMSDVWLLSWTRIFCSCTVTCQKLGHYVVQGRGGNWTTWKQLE